MNGEVNYIKFYMDIIFFTSKDEVFKEEYLRHIRAQLLERVKLDNKKKYVVEFIEEFWTPNEIDLCVLSRKITGTTTYSSVINSTLVSKDVCEKEIIDLHPYHLVLAYQTLDDYEKDRDTGIYAGMLKINDK